MSRLTDLLTERKTPEYTNVTGLKYTKYSNKVNLMRVLFMIETLEDLKAFPNKAKFELILLDKADLNMLTELKSLTRFYTPIVTGLKKGKKAGEMKILKEKFYKKFFPLLLNGLDINLNSVTLATTFAKSKHGVINQAQSKIILRLVKAIGKQEGDLTQKDQIELRMMRDSFTEDEETQSEIPQNSETPTEETPTEPKSEAKEKAVAALEQKFENKTADEIQQYVGQYQAEEDSLTSGKETKVAEQTALEQEFDLEVITLDEYTAAKFNFSKKNPALTQKITDTQMKLTAALQSQTFNGDTKKDARIKKIITTIVSDVVDSMSSHTPDFIGGSDLVPEIITQGNQVMIKMTDPNKTEDDFNFVRVLNMGNDGNIESIKHEYFVLPPEAQGSGVSKETIADSLRAYKAAGINRIDLHANIGMGGYVWLRYGFRPDVNQIDNIKAGFVDVTKAIRYGLKGGNQIGVSQEMATDGLIKQFAGTGLDTYITELKSKFVGLPEKIKTIQDELGFDSDFGDEKMVLSSSFNEVVADEMEKIGKKLMDSFEVNPATLSDDISLKSFDVKMGKKVNMEIDFSSKMKALPPRMHQQEADRIGKVLKSQIDEGIKVNKKGIAKWTITLSVDKAKIPVKKWLTIPGINVGDNKEFQAFPAGNDVSGEVWSLNWKGSLDLNDESQYNKALEYATIK